MVPADDRPVPAFSARLAFAWAALVAALGSSVCPRVRDPDLWWHVTAGRWMIANRTIPWVDHWNAFAAGKQWIAYSWSHEVLYSLAESAAGAGGLAALQAATCVLLVGSFWYVAGRIAGDHFVGAVLGTAVIAACTSAVGLRPQTTAWVLFAASLLVADRAARDGFTARRGLAAAAIFCLWANTHVTTVVGLFAVASWPAGVRGRYRDAALLAACAFAGTLITPYLGYEWIVFLSKSGHPVTHSQIIEFGPATILEYPTGILVILGAVLAVLAAGCAGAVFTPARVVTGVLFVVGGLAVVKFLPFATFYVAALAAAAWREPVASDGPGLRFRRAVRLARAAVSPHLGWGVAAVGVALTILYARPLLRRPLDPRIVPVASADFLRSGYDRPLLNGFGEGGYLMYRLSDEDGALPEADRVSMDGRTNVNPLEVADAHVAAFNGRSGWREFLRYVGPGTILWKAKSPFVQILEATGAWCVVHRSESAASGGLVVLFSREQAVRRGMGQKCSPVGAPGNSKDTKVG